MLHCLTLDTFEQSTPPEMLARTPRQHITTKTLQQEASVFYCGVFSGQLYMCLWIKFQVIADTLAALLEAICASRNKRLTLVYFFFLPPSSLQVFKSMRPFDVYLMYLDIQMSRHLYCYAFWQYGINSWQQIDGLRERKVPLVFECGEQEKQKFTNKRQSHQ